MINVLNNLDAEKQKIIFIVLVCILALYLDLGFVLRFQLQGLKTMGPKIAKLEKDIDTFNKDSANMQISKQRSGKETQKAKTLVNEQTLSALWQHISDLSNKNNVKINQMKPLKGKEEIVSGIKCVVYTASLDLSCAYHSLGSFLSDLENAEQFMAVQELRILSSQSDFLQQQVNLVLKIYARK